jgi:hypothetical protein
LNWREGNPDTSATTTAATTIATISSSSSSSGVVSAAAVNGLGFSLLGFLLFCRLVFLRGLRSGQDKLLQKGRALGLPCLLSQSQSRAPAVSVGLFQHRPVLHQ